MRGYTFDGTTYRTMEGEVIPTEVIEAERAAEAAEWEAAKAKAAATVASLSERERWALRQALAGPDGRYYGNGGTIHGSGELDVVLREDGAVAQVWFRCMPLAFRVSPRHRDDVLQGSPLTGVEVVDHGR